MATDVEAFYDPLGAPTAVVSGWYGMRLYDMNTGQWSGTNLSGPRIDAISPSARSSEALSDAVAGSRLIGIVNSRTPYVSQPFGAPSYYGAVGIGNLNQKHPTLPFLYDLRKFGFSCDPEAISYCTGLADELLHDVTITPNGARAIVTTRRNTLVLDLTADVDQTTATEYVTGCDPLNFPGPDAAVVSDSVVTTDAYAVVVGRSGGAPGVARACLIDLLQPPGPGAITMFDLGPATPAPPATTPWWVPSDVALGRDGAHAVVRLVDGSYPNPGSGNPQIWGRVVVINLARKSIELNIDLNTTAPGPASLGASQGVDSVLAGYKRAISLGELSSGHGYLQILTLD